MARRESSSGSGGVGRRSVLRSLGVPALAGLWASGYIAGGRDDDRAAAAARTDAPYSVVQGETCLPVAPLSGDEPITELYDYRTDDRYEGDNGAINLGERPYYQSVGTRDLQRRKTSLTFLYDGPEGLSLVVVHDKDTSRSTTGGAVSWTLRGVPSDAEWAVKDDLYIDPETGETYRSNYDRWDVDGTDHTVHWTWDAGGTDGGVLRTSGEDLDLTIDPAFNDGAEFWNEHYVTGPIEEWQVLSFPDGREDPVRHTVSREGPLEVHTTPCEEHE